MYQNVRIGSFFNVQLIMHYLNSCLSCSIRNLTLASLSRLSTIKIDVFALFRDQSLFMAGMALKRNWLGRQNITQDQSWVGKKI